MNRAKGYLNKVGRKLDWQFLVGKLGAKGYLNKVGRKHVFHRQWAKGYLNKVGRKQGVI